MTTVAVCALTFRRPRGLAALLDALVDLEVPPDVELRFVIVDNDPAGSAGEQVAAFAARTSRAVQFVVEADPGIPAARNAAIAASRNAEFVAFIDDDEVPDRRWIVELRSIQARTGADVVTGPVEPRFEVKPPGWIVRGGFFERPRFATGASLDWATTSSVLISQRLFHHEHPFNPAMRYTGGSDTHFFMRATMDGAKIVWADEALVFETIPVSRVSAWWLVRREYRRGNTLSICLRDLRDSPTRRLRRLIHATLRVIQGLGLMAFALVAGRVSAVRGAQRAAFGLGMVAGLIGLRYQEYLVLHGT
jgi:succinoglycan biosynthesis protein ExoM